MRAIRIALVAALSLILPDSAAISQNLAQRRHLDRLLYQPMVSATPAVSNDTVYSNARYDQLYCHCRDPARRGRTSPVSSW